MCNNRKIESLESLSVCDECHKKKYCSTTCRKKKDEIEAERMRIAYRVASDIFNPFYSVLIGIDKPYEIK